MLDHVEAAKDTDRRRAAPLTPGRREQILAAATSAFAEHGFGGASMREIATVAGFGHSLLLYHFRSKADLYVAVVENELEKLRQRLNAALERQMGAITRLTTFVEVYWRTITVEEPGLAVILRELHGLPGDIVASLVALSEWISALIESILTSGVHDGTFRPTIDPRACTFSILAILNMFVRIEAVDQVLHVYLPGLLPVADPASLDDARPVR